MSGNRDVVDELFNEWMADKPYFCDTNSEEYVVYEVSFRAGFEARKPAAELSRLWNRIGKIEHSHTETIAAKDGEIKFLKDLVLGMVKRMDALEQKMRSEGIVLRRHEAAINDRNVG